MPFYESPYKSIRREVLAELHPKASLSITLIGQVKGGKNNICITRTGRRFPNHEWAKWRDMQVAYVRQQLPEGFTPFATPVSVRLSYVAGDKRRRDMPAILDSAFHVMEKAGVVVDDTLIWVTESSRGYEKANPHCAIEFLALMAKG